VTNTPGGAVDVQLVDGGEVHYSPAIASLADTGMIFNLYDLQRTTVVQSAIDGLAPYVRSKDVFLLVSGNNSGTPSVSLISQWGEQSPRAISAERNLGSDQRLGEREIPRRRARSDSRGRHGDRLRLRAELAE